MAVHEPKPGRGEDLLTPSPPAPPPTTTTTTAASDRPARPHRTVRDAVRGFSTQWFLVPQGTAVLATILHQLDYRFRGLTVISYLFWVAAAALLLSTLGIYAARLALFPRHVLRTLRRDEVELAGLSSVSIAFTSVVQMASLTLVSAWGAPWGEVVYVLWWAAFALAALVALVLPFLFVKVYPSGVPHISPATQLPVIAALTAAAAGGTICASAALTSAQQVPVIVVSYLLIGARLPLVFALDVIFWARLLGNDQPPRQMAFQDMILCGPWGQSSFALQMLGRAVVGGSFAGYASGVFLAADAAGPVGYTSIFAGLTAWGLATFWWFFAIMGVFHAFLDGSVPKKIPYTLAGWALVFPWGVYTNAAVQLGKLLNSEAFKVWSTCLAIMLVAIWLVNVAFTIRMLARR